MREVNRDPSSLLGLLGMSLRTDSRFAASELTAPAAAAEDAQQQQEQVNEVEIERQRAEDAGLAARFAIERGIRSDPLDLLRVIGGQPHEDKHAEVGSQPIDHWAVE